MDALKILSEFVVGGVSPQEFERLLHADRELIEELSQNDPLPPYAGENELYMYMISANLSLTGSLLNAKDVVSRFLKAKGIDVPLPKEALDALKLKLAVLPKWLSVPDTYFESLMLRGSTKGRKDLETWLKQEIKENFVCLAKPPKWLQSPDWQFSEGVPLIFVGQLELTAVRHDLTFAYVFLNKASGNYRVIEQSA